MAFSSLAFARVDPIHEYISEDYPAIIEWGNIEGKPVWLSGQSLKYSFFSDYNSGLHSVKLKKGESISLHLNQLQQLKIISVDGLVLNNDLIVESSNGTSLYSVLEIKRNKNKNHLIIDALNTVNRIIKISNTADKERSLSFFISRIDYAKQLIVYRDLLELPLDSFKLFKGEQYESKKYWLLNKNKKFSLKISGPIRISLQARLKYINNFYEDKQKFYLSYSIDKEKFHDFHFTAQQDVSNLYTIDDINVAIAHAENLYIDVPAGEHEVWFNSSESVYIRLLKLDEPDYLFPGLNQTSTSIDDAKRLYNELNIETKDVKSLLFNKELFNKNLTSSLYNLQWIAEFIAINNEIRDSALDAAALLKLGASSARGLAKANVIVEKFRRQHTFYRHLFPYENNKEQSISTRSFILYPLRQSNKSPLSYYREGSLVSKEAKKEPLKDVTLNPSLLCDSLNQGHFFSLTDSLALTYYLSERVHNSRLRIVIDKNTISDNDTFYLQYDNNKVIKFKVSAESELPVSYFNSTSSEACASYLMHNKNSNLSLMKYQLTDVAFLEISLSAKVRKIKLWKSSSSGASPLKIALQYQSAKLYKMSQQYYINLISEFNNENKLIFLDLFVPVIKNIEADTLSLSLSKENIYRLTQYWQPLKNFLQSRKTLFLKGYIKSDQENKNNNSNTFYASDKRVKTLYREILSKRKKKLWVDIIELFSAVQVKPDHPYFIDLHKQFYYALEQSGESLLRERLLKGALLFNKSKNLQLTAFELLKKYYETYQLDNKLTQLLITQAYINNSEMDFRTLVIDLVNRGYNDFALQIGLLLEQDVGVDIQLNTALIHASLSEKKWQFYEYLLNKIEDKSNHSNWEALKALALGDITLLKNNLLQNDKTNYFTTELIKQVLSVDELIDYSDMESPKTFLLNSDFLNTEDFLKKWTQWSYWKLKNDPENGLQNSWKDSSSLITHAEGSVVLYNQERNLLKTYQRSDQKNPVKLSLIGPARIRIGVRLLYNQFDQERINTSLILHDNNRQLLSPLMNSIPSQGQTINELPESIVGTIQYFEYNVGEGEHHIQYYADQYELISTLETQQLSIPIPFLPDLLTPDFLFSNSLKSQTELTSIKQSYKPTRKECVTNACMALYKDMYYEYLPRVQSVNNNQVDSSLSDRTSLRHSVSFSAETGDFYSTKILDIQYLKNQFKQLCLSNSQNNKLPFIIESLEAPIKKQTAHIQCYQEKERVKKALLMLSKMSWYLKQHPEHKAIINVWAGTILQQWSQNPEINKFYSFFEQQYQWQLQSSVIESAGINFSSISGWQPLSSYARIRKSLLKDHNDSTILTNNYILGINLENNVDSQLKVRIKNLGLPYFLQHEVRLRYQLNDQNWKYINVNQTQETKYLKLSIPSGEHTFKIQWLNPMIMQYVSLDLINYKYQKEEKLYNEIDRYYHIAAPDEPVKIIVEGPVRVRVDYRLNDNSNAHDTEYLMIPDGWHKLTLPVFNNRHTISYRVYLRTFDEHAAHSQIPYSKTNINSLPFSQWYKDINITLENNSDHNTDNSDVDEIYNDDIPAHQEDGTFSFGVLWSQGEDQEEKTLTTNNTKNNDYFEYNLSHYLFVEHWNTYFDTELLYRDHDSGKPTLGFKETIFIQPDWLSFSLRFDWKYFSQEYDSPKGNKTASSSYLNLGIEQLFNITAKWQHLPRLTIFDKNYNNSGFLNSQITNIDQDVWSQYGDIHDKGLIISDTLYYKPWLDTQLSTGFSYTSDEDYRLDKPEHATLRFGWLQKLDQFILDMEYRRIYYFSEKDHNWDRISSSNKGIIKSDLYWENWNFNSKRFLAKLKMSYDTQEDEFYAGIGFKYYFDQGRGFRDFRPHTQSFRRLRERQRFIKNESSSYNYSTVNKDK